MSLNIQSAARGDVFKFSSAVIAQRLFEGKPLNTNLWVVATVLSIIGFVAYQLLLNSWLDTSKLASGSAKVAIDDILKFSTMFVVGRILTSGLASGFTGVEAGTAMNNEEWIKDSGLFIASLVTYDLLLSDLVANKTVNLDRNVNLAVNDGIKMSIVLSCYNFAKGGSFDKQFLVSSGGFITGLVVYDLLIEKFAKKYIDTGSI
jgi:hypothetical protein